jgi:predicted porin
LKQIIKFLLILSFFFNYSFAISSKYYQEKYNTTKKLYLGSVMSNNKKNEIKYLKRLISYGEKLKIDTIKYKRELNRLDKSVVVTKPIKTTFRLKPKYTIKSDKSTNTIAINNQYKITKKLSLNSSLMYLMSKDKDENKTFGKEKEDKFTTLSLGTSYKITKKLSTSLDLKHIQNDSNIVIYTYDKQTATLNFKYFF